MLRQKRWARTTIHSGVVRSVCNAWEMERQHAAERRLHPDAMADIQRIRKERPDVVAGAVADGSADPTLTVLGHEGVKSQNVAFLWTPTASLK